MGEVLGLGRRELIEASGVGVTLRNLEGRPRSTVMSARERVAFALATSARISAGAGAAVAVVVEQRSHFAANVRADRRAEQDRGHFFDGHGSDRVTGSELPRLRRHLGELLLARQPAVGPLLEGPTSP